MNAQTTPRVRRAALAFIFVTVLIDVLVVAGALVAGIVLYLAVPKAGETIEEFR